VSSIDLDKSNGNIVCPTLVIAGSSDEATPPVMSERIARHIPGAQLRFVSAAHLSAVEQPDAFASLLTDFWAGLAA
jgi:3-oxoadipate enol-lactonase